MKSDEIKEKEVELILTCEAAPETVAPTSDVCELSLVDESMEEFPSFADRYEAVSIIGQGGMGVVYKAKDKLTDSVVAIKVLKKELTADKAALKRFESEVSSLAELDHENLVALYGQGQTLDGAPYLVMEYIEGKSLAQLLENEKQINPKRAIALLLQICDGLAQAHQKGIVHRDLKPSNIMISQPGEAIETVRILDFGIARIVESTAGNTTNLTQTGEVFGTPNYMSPEQCEGRAIDHRSDIYSLGCIMYELFAGRLPFAGSNPIQVAVKHINEKPVGFNPSTRKKLKQPLKSLESITLFCLSKDALERYQAIDELREDLKKVHSGKKVSRQPVGRGRPQLLNRFGLWTLLYFYVLSLVVVAGTNSFEFESRYLNTSIPSIRAITFLSMNAIGSLLILIVLLRDRVAFKTPGRRLEEFWNLMESSLFATSIWIAMALWAISLGFNLYSWPMSWIVSVLGMVSVITFACGFIVEIKLLIAGKFKKYLTQPYNPAKAKKQASLLLASVCAALLISSIAIPKFTAYIPYGAAETLLGCAPQATNIMNDAALVLNPQMGAAYELKAKFDIASGKANARVLAPLNAALTKYPGEEKLLLARARVHKALKQPELAIEDYGKAISTDPESTIYPERAMLLTELGRYDKAIEDYTQQLHLYPDQEACYTSRGLLRAKVKHFSGAIEDLSTAIALSKRFDKVDGYLRRALVHELDNQKELAHNDYLAAERLLDNATPLTRAFVYRKLGERDRADQVIKDMWMDSGNSTAELKTQFADQLFAKDVHLPFTW